MGIERILLMISQESLSDNLDVYFITDGDAAFEQAFKLSNMLRDTLPNLHLVLHCGGGSLKNQFKKADKSGARIALILGEQEMENKSIIIKMLRESTPQVLVLQDELAERLQKCQNLSPSVT
jgi:histidyl-tRNA synthetase